MRNKSLLFCFLYFLLLLPGLQAFGQQTEESRVESLRARLDILSFDIPNLKTKISASVSGVSLFEFLRGVAIENKVNMNIDPALDSQISINFTSISIQDLLSYVCEQYGAEILIKGTNIISVVKYMQIKPEATPVLPKKLKIAYDSSKRLITYDLQNDTLGNVVKLITQLTGINVVTTQKLQYGLVSGYMEKTGLKKAIAELAHMNNLQFTDRDSMMYYLEEASPKLPATDNNKNTPALATGAFKVTTNHKDSIVSITANNVPIKDILAGVATKLSINYFVLTEMKGSVDFKIDNVDFITFLKYLFNNTDYTYSYSNGIYLIGERRSENIRTSTVYKLMYRTTNKIMEMIPPELKKNIDIIPLVDLNSVIISGSAPAVNELGAFLRQIDQVVPVVTIELIILDISKTHNISTGISAGLGSAPVSSTYNSVFPNVDVTLGSSTINNLINSINGSGLINLGKVNSNFYLSLQASEENGQIRIRSTPKLATLNGTEAQMAIGETRYYAETTSNIIATQSTTTVNSTVYKPLQANLSVTIKPIVSGDEQITLDVTVEQGSFTNQIATNGPFGQTTRTFKSVIRVKNNDMILLGGLEQMNNSNSGKGFPILANIPILKWLFSSRSVKNSKTKLAILIHPTVIM